MNWSSDGRNMRNGGRWRWGVRQYNRSEVPRIRWTKELHARFVEAVNSLGGYNSKLLPRDGILSIHRSSLVSTNLSPSLPLHLLPLLLFLFLFFFYIFIIIIIFFIFFVIAVLIIISFLLLFFISPSFSLFVFLLLSPWGFVTLVLTFHLYHFLSYYLCLSICLSISFYYLLFISLYLYSPSSTSYPSSLQPFVLIKFISALINQVFICPWKIYTFILITFSSVSRLILVFQQRQRQKGF